MKWIQYIVLLLVTAVISFYLTGIFNPFVGYEFRLTVRRPVGAAWSVLSDPHRMPDWVAGLQRVEPIAETARGAGNRYRLVVVKEGREKVMTEQITIWRPPAVLGFRLEDDVWTTDARIQCEAATDSTTELIFQNRITSRRFFWRAVLTLFKSSFVEPQQEDYRRLKDLIETTPVP